MRYRTKLLLLFVTLAIVSNGILFALLYRQAKNFLREQMETTALSISTTTAALIDGDAHQRLKTREDEKREEYLKVATQLRQARDANRRSDVYVKFLYTMIPQTNNPGMALFAVDPEESEADKSHLGDLYLSDKSERPVHIDFGANQVQPGFVKDQWGTWLTVNAPFKNAAGQRVGVVGVDLKASDVLAKLNLLFFAGLASLAVTVMVSLVMALVLANNVNRPLAVLREAMNSIGQGNLQTKVEMHEKNEFGEMAECVNNMVLGLRQRENLKQTLVRYVSSQVAEDIFKGDQMPNLSGDRRKITVLFADVRGFTSISEKMNPEDVVAILDEYFDKMIEIIFKHNGMLNKFLGDGLMAIFGAPNEDADQEEHALRAALDMREAVQLLRRRWQDQKGIELKVGIGVNTGIAVVGNIGSQQRMEYTAIGDTVNLASRLERASKELGTDIVVSDYTYVAVRHLFPFKSLNRIQVKGRTESVGVYGLEEPPTHL